MAELISDDFEDETFDAWTGTSLGGGDLSIAGAAALHGNFGYNMLINDNDDKICYLQVAAKTRVRSRFYFDPNGLTMGEGDYFRLYSTQETGGARPFIVWLYMTGGAYKIFARIANDAAGFTDTASEYTISDAPHCIEVDFYTSSGADDGFLSLWIDGVLKNTISGIDNDTLEPIYLILGIEFFDAGASATSGTYYVDDFVANDDGGEIGLISEDNAIFFGTNF